MVRYCQSCGRAVPNDAVICPYCAVHIDYTQSQVIPDQILPKEKSSKWIIIVVVILALLIIVPILIAATMYVYVSNMLPPEHDINYEDAHVSILAVDKQLQITLIRKGNSYSNGYLMFDILINDESVQNLDDVGYWEINESIIIGEGTNGYEVGGSPLTYGEYHVEVYIYESLIANTYIDV